MEFDIIYGLGISKEGELVDMAADDGIIEKSGTWYSYGEERIGQGRENAKRFLIENPDACAQIRSQGYGKTRVFKESGKGSVTRGERWK